MSDNCPEHHDPDCHPLPDLDPCKCACEEIKTPPPPEYKEPTKCTRDPKCKCPTAPPTSPLCLETLINEQTSQVTEAANADALKKELQAFLDAAKKAATTYTRDQYKDLVKKWFDQDALFAELIRKLVCAVKCWKCILECYVCPIINDLRFAEKSLYDDGQIYNFAYDLYDKQYVFTKQRSAAKRVLDRIDGILKAWQDPAATIRAAQNTNQGLYDAASKVIGTEPGKAIYDVFLKLIPLHLAIAPNGVKSKIDKKFTLFCDCDDQVPVLCCCVDVGPWKLRQRLIGPQPFLIDPGRYFDLICCLVEKRYVPAKKTYNEIDLALTKVTTTITTYEKQLADALNPQNANNLEKTAKGAIPGVIDCCDYDAGDDRDCGDKE